VVEEWGAKEVQALAGTGHNIILNADWIAEFSFWVWDVIRWKDISEAMRWETD